MIIFWILLAFSYLFYVFCRGINVRLEDGEAFDEHIKNSDIKAYFVFMTILMVIIIGFRREDIGIDTQFYSNAYQKYKDVPFSYIFDPSVKEKGYVLLEILLNKLGFNFTGFNIIYAIFNCSVVSYLIYKKSEIPWFSYFLYICFSFFLLNLTMMRQTLAISIVILAVLKDKNEGFGDFIKFCIWIFVAYMFHSSAIVALPLWFVRKLPYDDKLISVMIAGIVLCYIFKGALSGIVMKIAVNISEKYESYAQTGTGSAGLKLYMMVGASVMFGMILREYLSDRWHVFMFYCMCTMMLIFPALQGGGAILRAYYYFYVFIIIYVPNMLSAVKGRKNSYFKTIIFALYIAVGLYFFNGELSVDSYEVIPYKFFWQ